MQRHEDVSDGWLGQALHLCMLCSLHFSRIAAARNSLETKCMKSTLRSNKEITAFAALDSVPARTSGV